MILCIDDDPNILNLLEKILSDLDDTIVMVDNAQQGLAEAISKQPDLILLDIMMPELGGYEVCKRLKSNEATMSIPIIFLTAKSEEESEDRGLKLGAVDYIRKPFHSSIVRSRVKAHLDLKLKTNLLEKLAAIDGLTNICNRRKFDEILDQEYRRAIRNDVPLSLLMIDVDRFKDYNDRYGHAAGDDCLRRIARGLNDMLSRPGDLLARYGGEEFSVILPQTDFKGATHMASHLVKGLEELKISPDHSPEARPVTVSIGAASCRPGQDQTTPLQLIEAADSMLYLAKHNGRNQCQGKDLSLTDGH